jgi:hypothetical protein
MFSISVERCKVLLVLGSSRPVSAFSRPSTLPVGEKIEFSPLLVPHNLSAEQSDHCNSFCDGSKNRSAGVLTTYASWRWAFYLQGILTTCFAFAVFFFVPNDSRQVTRREPIDWFGALLVSGGLCTFCFALTDADTSPNGWGTSYIIVSLILGPSCILLFLWLQSRLQYPLMPLSIWRYPQFPRVIATYFLGFTTFAGVLIFNYTLMWQLVFGRNALGVPPS